MAQAVKAKFQQPTPEHRIETALTCTDLSAPQVMWFARGSRNQGSLELWRISRDDVRAELAGLIFHEWGRPRVRYIHANLSQAEVESALDTAIVATALTVNLIAPKEASLSESWFSTSNDFHRSFTLADETGRQLTRWFTGYERSMDQTEWLPLQLASRPFERFLEQIGKSGVNGRTAVRKYQDSDQAQDIDRTHFAEHFLRAATHFDEPNAWWVKERFVELSRSLGAPKLIAPLLQQLEPGTGQSVADTRHDALAALKSITGYDPANDGHTTEEQQIAAFKKACAY